MARHGATGAGGGPGAEADPDRSRHGHWTAEEFFAMAAKGRLGGRPHQLIAGVIVSIPAATARQEATRRRTREVLDRHARRTGLGPTHPDGTGFATRRNPDTARTADLLFHASPRYDHEWDGGPGLLSDAPDLAVIVPDSDADSAAWRRVRDEYINAGVAMVWRLDPSTRSVLVDREDEPTLTLRAEDRAELEDFPELPDFHCRVDDLFPIARSGSGTGSGS